MKERIKELLTFIIICIFSFIIGYTIVNFTTHTTHTTKKESIQYNVYSVYYYYSEELNATFKCYENI